MKNRFTTVLVKIVLAIALIVLLCLPIVQNWKMFAFLAGILGLIYSDIILEKRRIIWGVGVVVFILAVKYFLPVAGIEEGHNIFLVFEPGATVKTGDECDAIKYAVPLNAYDAIQGKGTLQQSLPAAVYDDWRREFNSLYPPLEPLYEAYTWRDAVCTGAAVPDSAYAWSSDSLWRPAKYSRKVDEISFSSLAGFRGGFANDLRYNWWNGDLSRNSMPFFVMYEFSNRSVGCELFWKGDLFWEKPDGSYEKVYHPALSGRTITPIDAGKKAYLLFLPKKTPVFPVHLKLNRTLAASRIFNNILTVAGFFFICMFMVRLRWRPFMTAAAIVMMAMAVVYACNEFSPNKTLGAYYNPHAGGDDGLVHESLGHEIVKFFSEGRIAQALEGHEPVYWNTPGMRYFRAVEKTIFGDTNLGLTALLACLPLWVFLLFQRLCGSKWACAGLVIFILSPASFSFVQYIACGLLGYAEPVGSGLFIIGSFLLMKSQPRWGGIVSAWSAFLGGACLAGSFFIRPNYAIAAVLLGIFYIYASLRDRHFLLLFPVLAGLGLSLFMPLHNYYFGHEFHLIRRVQLADLTALPLSPMTYLRAFVEWITGFTGHGAGRGQTPHLAQVVHQIKGWLWTLPILPASLHRVVSLFLSFRLLILFTTLYALFISPRRLPGAAMMAWVALAAHIPMLFVFDTAARYDALGWDLSMIVTIMLAAYITSHRSLPPLFKAIETTANSRGLKPDTETLRRKKAL